MIGDAAFAFERDGNHVLRLVVFRLLEDVPLRERLARTGAERARAEFSWDAITAQYIQVFEKCLP